jgi:hypothetical protein
MVLVARQRMVTLRKYRSVRNFAYSYANPNAYSDSDSITIAVRRVAE